MADSNHSSKSSHSTLGSRPRFVTKIRKGKKEKEVRREYPATLKLTKIKVQIGTEDDYVEPALRSYVHEHGVCCEFRSGFEIFATKPFKPERKEWQGEGEVKCMMSSASFLHIKVTIAGDPEVTLGYARLCLGELGGEGHLELTAEIRDSELVSSNDQLLGYITFVIEVLTPFKINLTKLDSQFSAKNLSSLMHAISSDSSSNTNAFNLNFLKLKSTISDLKRMDMLGTLSAKQLDSILNMANNDYLVESCEDLVEDIVAITPGMELFSPSITNFPCKKDSDAFAESRVFTGDLFDSSMINLSFALHLELQEPLVLVAETEEDWLRWTAAISVACGVNVEFGEKRNALNVAIPDYCRDPFCQGRPTAGWLKRQKKSKKTFSVAGDYVRRFFKLELDQSRRFALSYAHDPADDPKTITRLVIGDGAKLILPQMLLSPTPFVISATVLGVQEMGGASAEGDIIATVQLGTEKQRGEFGKKLLLPVSQELLVHVGPEVISTNIGWEGEEVKLPLKREDDAQMSRVVFSLGGSFGKDAIGHGSLSLDKVPFGKEVEMALELEGTTMNNAELSISIALKRLAQFNTAWPAQKIRIIQTSIEPDADDWVGSCAVRAGTNGLELFRPVINNGENASAEIDHRNIAMLIDYNSIEAITPLNENTLDIAVVIEPPDLGEDKGFGSMQPMESKSERTRTDSHRSARSILSLSRRSSFGMVNYKGKSLNPTKSSTDLEETLNSVHDYIVLRVTPCPAVSFRDLLQDRKNMCQDRAMLLYITNKLEEIRQDPEFTPRLIEKVGCAAADTVRHLINNLKDIVKTADWNDSLAGFTRKQARNLLHAQRLSCYLARLIELKPPPVWALEASKGPDPRPFARRDLASIFSFETFQLDSNKVDNSIIGVENALKSLRRRLDEVQLYFHDDQETLEKVAASVIEEYYLRCVSELGCHVTDIEFMKGVSLDVVVGYVCFFVKRDESFVNILAEHDFEPDLPPRLSNMISVESVFQRLSALIEEEIIVQVQAKGEMNGDANAYITSVLGECIPDSGGRLSTKIPGDLIQLVEKYLPLIASECEGCGKNGAGLIESMLAALSSRASNVSRIIASMNHTPCAWNAVRYLSAILNDLSRYETLVNSLIEMNREELKQLGLAVDTASVFSRLWIGGAEVGCLLADIALKQVDDVCAGFFQSEWRENKQSSIMRKACKLLCRKLEELEGMIHAEPYFSIVIEAGILKIAFRYISSFIQRASDSSLGLMDPFVEVEKMISDVSTMEMFLRKYGDSMIIGFSHLKELINMMTSSSEQLENSKFKEIARRHKGNEEHVYTILKLCAAAREDLRTFYVPAWLNKLKLQMESAIEHNRRNSRSSVQFDLFHWSIISDFSQPNGSYIYAYLAKCLTDETF